MFNSKKYAPVLYVLENEDGSLYVGQSGRGTTPRGRESLNIVGRYNAPVDRHDREVMETELIQSYIDMGIDVSNIQQRHQPDRRWWRR